MSFRFAIPAMIACAATSASAQELAWSYVPLLGGQVSFHGAGSVTAKSDGEASFWRPLVFGEAGKPVGGRMDCDVSAASEPFTDAAFDLDARYAAEAERRKRREYYDDTQLRDYGDDLRRLDVIGHRFTPLRHYVLSLVARREGDTIYDVRMNCRFTQGSGDEGKPNWSELVRRYTAFDFAPAPAEPNPAPEARS